MEIVGIGRQHTNELIDKKEKGLSKVVPKSISKKSNPINDIGTDTAELLQSALYSGSIQQYNEALLLERYRDALLEHARTLHQDISEDIQQKVKELAPKTYGWKGSSVMDQYTDGFETNYQESWETIRKLEAQQYPLEDEHISQEFFNDLQDALIGRDISSLNQNLMKTYTPWLLGKKDTHLISHRAASKKIRKKIPVKRLPCQPKKKSIAQQKFEKYLQEKESALQSELNTKFKATPIPASSLVPKFKELIANQGTRSTTIREKAIQEYIQQLEASKKPKGCFKKQNTVLDDIMKEIGQEPMPLPQKMQLDIQRRISNSEESLKKAGLTKEHTFQPKITKHLPNFQRLHESFYAQLEKKKAAYSPTVIQPFKGLDANEMKKKEKVKPVSDVSVTKVKPIRIPKEIDTPKVTCDVTRLFRNPPIP
jgi:polyhydroxyalkanoate synthesis regulator phasin